MKKSLITYIGLVSVVLLQACAPTAYNVKNPAPSSFSYQEASNAPQSSVILNDRRSDDDKEFSYGILKADLTLDDEELDPISYLRENVPLELGARGLSVNFNESGDTNVDINKLVMRNHRVSGFSPFVTFTMLSADVDTTKGDQHIGIFIRRGKVPVWSFDEIVEPTMNEPLDILVKEFASKINTILYGKSASDSRVSELVEKINTNIEDGKVYLDVYQLGFSNNKKAIQPLVEYTKNEKEYIRQAAISSLGNLKAEEQLDYLKSISEDAERWSDRAMALKAIGDIGNDDAIAYLQEKLSQLESDTDKKAKWSAEIIQLYLQ